MEANQRLKSIFPQSKDYYHLAPIPLIMHKIQDADKEEWHAQLLKDAQEAFNRPTLEVPDVRHIYDMGMPPESTENYWTEAHNPPAVGVWHRVPTNQYLSLNTPAVKRLRALVERYYIQGVLASGGSAPRKVYISESWIQFYSNGDYKVLHNHERYGPPYPSDSWAGAYYIDDGSPDPNMPYAGIFSFRVRNSNHFIRPHPGLLLIWPAEILHEVHPFYGDGERVVVNFNINSSEIVWA